MFTVKELTICLVALNGVCGFFTVTLIDEESKEKTNLTVKNGNICTQFYNFK